MVTGDGFKPALIDPVDLFGGSIDHERTLVQEDAACQFSFHGGKYQVAIMPNRASVEAMEPVMSGYLVSNVEHLFGILDKYRGAVSVSGWGMNCYTTFSLGTTGTEYCRRLMRSVEFDRLINGADSGDVSIWLRGEAYHSDMKVTVRIEPKVDADGKLLFVSVNGHRDLSGDDMLAPGLESRVASFNQYVEALHERITENG